MAVGGGGKGGGGAKMTMSGGGYGDGDGDRNGAKLDGEEAEEEDDGDGDEEESHLLSWDAIRRVYALEGYDLDHSATTNSNRAIASTAPKWRFTALTAHARALTDVGHDALPRTAASGVLGMGDVGKLCAAVGVVRQAAAQD